MANRRTVSQIDEQDETLILNFEWLSKKGWNHSSKRDITEFLKRLLTYLTYWNAVF